MSAKKFKVGDKIRLRSDLKKYNDYGGTHCNSKMATRAGSILTIKGVQDAYYNVEACDYVYSDEMFMDHKEMGGDRNPHVYEVGDRVEIVWTDDDEAEYKVGDIGTIGRVSDDNNGEKSLYEMSTESLSDFLVYAKEIKQVTEPVATEVRSSTRRFKAGDVVVPSRIQLDRYAPDSVYEEGQEMIVAEDSLPSGVRIEGDGVYKLEEWKLKVKSSQKKGTTFMSNIKNLFKSKKQKLFERYVYNGEGIDWNSPVVQEVILKAHEKELMTVCNRLEAERKEADK